VGFHCHACHGHPVDRRDRGLAAMTQRTPFERKLATLTGDITEAAAAFEARWTLAGLRRTNPGIGERLVAQVELWHAAAAGGSAEAIEAQGMALVRGYRKAVEIMSTVEPDAYVVGKCQETGFTVVIGHCPATAKHAADAEGKDAVWLTPDEVANLLPKLSGFQTIAEIKRAFPGALCLAASETQCKAAKAGAE
jgi:hypothetical protein